MAGVDLSGGYVRLWRKAEFSQAFQDKDSDIWKVWSWLMMRASWKPIVQEGGNEVLVGQLTCGRFQAADKLKLSPSKFYRCLKKLEKWNQITLKSNTNYTTITLCNWITYNPASEECGHPSEHNSGQQVNTTSDTTLNTLKESKASKEGKECKEKNTSADKPPVVKTPRPRDPLWDAIVSITGADATLPKIAKQIGGVKKELLSAKPPYTPEEVLRLREIAPKFLPWSVDRFLTLPEVQAKIYLVRADPAQTVSRNGSGSKADLFGGMASWAEKAEADGTLNKEYGT